MYGMLAVIEQTRIALWMREDDYAYFVALIVHAIGMALLVGGGIVIGLTALLGADRPSMQALLRFQPVLWLGAALAVVSGVLLLAAYPAKALTNPVFAIKFVCLMGAATLQGRLLRQERAVIPPRLLAALTLLLWLGGVAAGKMLLHTYHVLMVS
jgi:hypothetical protein